jgi:hypothetical protein
MALPFALAACTSEDLVSEQLAADQFAGIEKVNAEFKYSEGVESRLQNNWNVEAGDVLGFAWLGTDVPGEIMVDGRAWQNHPLTATEGSMFKPATSIYVGKYFTYAPYDQARQSIGNVSFNSLAQSQILESDGVNANANYALAKNSIWISPDWTEIATGGTDLQWTINPTKLSNIVTLNMDYVNNDLIDPAIGAPEIEKIEVAYINGSGTPISVQKFDYAPIAERHTSNLVAPKSDFWADYSFATSVITSIGIAGVVDPVEIKAFEHAAVTTGSMVIEPAGTYLVTQTMDKDAFKYNALPAAEEIDEYTKVQLKITTTYGVITIEKAVKEIAKTVAAGVGTNNEYANFDGDASALVAPKGAYEYVESFIQCLNKNGRLYTDVDFFTAVMDGMHVENDTKLQQMLKFYKEYKKYGNAVQREDKAGTNVKLYLDGDANGEFRLSKTSIALLQEINDGAGELLVSIQKCTVAGEACTKLIVTGGDEVPATNRVFQGGEVTYYLAAGEDWKWETPAGKEMGYVKNIYNEGELTINAAKLEAYKSGVKMNLNFVNLNTVNVTSAAKVEFDLTNEALINIVKNAELKAFNETIINYGTIDNNGVLATVDGTTGKVHNYGTIDHDDDAKTFITTNELGGDYTIAPNKASNLIGTINITDKFAWVSVSNATTEGMIKYAWNAATDGAVYATPQPEVDVKYNYLIISDDITFTQAEPEIKYIEIEAGNEVVITAEKTNNVFESPNRLRGLIIENGATLKIQKGNKVAAAIVYCPNGSVYYGGEFTYDNVVSYFGGEADDVYNFSTF